MPLNFMATVYVEGRQTIPYYDTLKFWAPAAALVAGAKYYFAGPRNSWERDLHGRVYLVTGGTSGLGAETVKELALRGAHVVLLVRSVDEWVVEHVDALRSQTNNPCIYVEHCDLASLESVRTFATKWIDNMPARRLDGVVCCAATILPPSAPLSLSQNGVEIQTQVNYLAHYLLLTVLAPAIRAQPPDREVRVVLVNCISAVMADLVPGDIGFEKRSYPARRSHLVQGEAKLSLALLGYELQRQFDAYERKDGAPPNIHVAVVDPGMMRSPSFRRFITFSRLWMLFLYLLLWPVWWLFLKSSVDGCQSMLFALMSPEILERKLEAVYVSNVRVRPAPPRSEFSDVPKQKELFEQTAALLERVEKNTWARKNAQEARAAAGGNAKSKTKKKSKKGAQQ